jgi:T-complex protein 1 subunit alpha
VAASTSSSSPSKSPTKTPNPSAAATKDREATESTIAKRRNYKNYGLDLTRGKVVDQIRAGVLEPSMSKIRQLKSAVEACIAIMRIDTLIKLDPEQKGGGAGDDGHGH